MSDFLLTLFCGFLMFGCGWLIGHSVGSDERKKELRQAEDRGDKHLTRVGELRRCLKEAIRVLENEGRPKEPNNGKNQQA